MTAGARMFVFRFMCRLCLKCVGFVGLVLVVGNVCGQQFNGTIVDLDSGGIQTFQGQTIDRDRDHRERMANYERISAEMSASINAKRQEGEMRNQTRELREQTELLRNMSEERSGESSTSYVPPPIIVAPSSSVPPRPYGDHVARGSRASEDFFESQALHFAQRAKSFHAASKQPRDRQLSASESPSGARVDNPTNDTFIEGLLQGYEGGFTDYKWTLQRVDSQTYLVTCSVSLDGETHDFQFRVNSVVGSCRYVGGTALSKLNSPKTFTPPPPIPDNEPATSASSSFDPDEYLNDKTGSHNKPHATSDGTKPWEQFGGNE